MIKNILLFTYGDSNNPSTWSNVPYLFTNTLEEKGYHVIRVDMSTKRTIFSLAYTLFMKIIKPSTTYYYVKSKRNRKLVEDKIRQAVEKYDDIVDLYISISFDFSTSMFTRKKVLFISDWPIEYAIERRFNRTPDWLEKKDIKRHQEVIEKATYRVSLFQDVANYMNEKYKSKTIYLGGLINSFYPIEGFERIDHRNKITFIGKKSYYQSAKELITAFNHLDQALIQKKKIELHIIGMTKDDFKDTKNQNIYFHGYLDKGQKEQREKYYNILKDTMVIVNTSDKWAGMSSIIESMYYYRPIITSKYEEYVKTFTDKIDFGYYCDNQASEIQKCLEKILSLDKKKYQKMAQASHEAVKEFTYDTYIDKILNLVTDEKDKKKAKTL